MITKRRHIVLALSAALLLSATAMPASAKPGKWKAHSQNTYVQQVDQNYVLRNNAISSRTYRAQSHNQNQGYFLTAQNSISAAEAKSIARRRVKGGEVVDIAKKGNIYRVRVIAKDGQVVDVLIDANTGRVKR